MRNRGLLQVLALLFSFAMIAAACGGSSSSSGGSDGGTTDDTEGEDAGPATTVAATTTSAEGGDEGSGPVHGGTLIYGVEADSANPFAHYRTSCAISCFAVFKTVSDSLFRPIASGGVEGELVESWEANEDHTVHTWTIREGIEFHDGTPLDGEAVAFNINACRASTLTGPALTNVADVAAEGQTVTITTAIPWVPIKNSFAGGSCSYMFSPTWMSSLADVPFRTEDSPFFSEEIAATPADGDPSAPVGVGPFVFESYTPGNGNSFVATRNDNYWRGENGITGEELPYLDGVEIVVASDVASRTGALESGQFHIIHTSNGDEIANLQSNGDLNTIAANDFGETSYLMINTATGTNPTLGGAEMDPTGANATSPLQHLSCRKALAHAVDQQRLSDERYAGLADPANGPFPPGSMGYLEDSGYPAYDIALAQEEFAKCQADAGTEVIQFAFNTTNDPFNVETNQIISEMWQEAFGANVETSITPIEQGAYIGTALVGQFQMLGWRSHGGTDPDSQFLWWHSGTASPIGALALNFGRFQDPAIDEALVAQRVTADEDARREAAEAINRSFAENVWNIWTVWNLWGVSTNQNVQNLLGPTLPDGTEMRPFVNGQHGINQIWCTDGSCQS